MIRNLTKKYAIPVATPLEFPLEPHYYSGILGVSQNELSRAVHNCEIFNGTSHCAQALSLVKEDESACEMGSVVNYFAHSWSNDSRAVALTQTLTKDALLLLVAEPRYCSRI